jgi:ubiquinone/menaquinone biosynthesis C-methylase UbiE
MDGQALQFPDAVFDVVILHLILAVIPDPFKAIKEAERVLRPGGRIAVLDKFLPTHQKAGITRIIINQFTKFMFSDINRKIEDLVATTQLEIKSDISANFGGIFRRLLL